jgi:hypothetical protein
MKINFAEVEFLTPKLRVVSRMQEKEDHQACR